MRFALLLAPAAVLILLAGCSGTGGHRAATPSATAAPTSPALTSASPTPTPSPTATTPLLTGAAVKPGEVPPTEDPHFITDDSGGAIAFAGYFYRALDWSIATTNANLLRPISDPSCVECQKFIDEIDAFAAKGGHSEGARILATKFAPAHGDLVQSQFVIQVTLTQEPEVFVNADGTRSTPSPPTNPTVSYLYMDWQNSDFVALGIG
jgi:Family of unknown function (DUF6318)